MDMVKKGKRERIWACGGGEPGIFKKKVKGKKGSSFYQGREKIRTNFGEAGKRMKSLITYNVSQTAYLLLDRWERSIYSIKATSSSPQRERIMKETFERVSGIWEGKSTKYKQGGEKQLAAEKCLLLELEERA